MPRPVVHGAFIHNEANPSLIYEGEHSKGRGIGICAFTKFGSLGFVFFILSDTNISSRLNQTNNYERRLFRARPWRPFQPQFVTAQLTKSTIASPPDHPVLIKMKHSSSDPLKTPITQGQSPCQPHKTPPDHPHGSPWVSINLKQPSSLTFLIFSSASQNWTSPFLKR